MPSKPVIISAEQTMAWPDLAEVFRSRALIFMLAKRQIRGRYAQAALGIFWALIQPVSYMLVLNLFFALTAHFPARAVPYPLFLLSGLLLYQFFVKCVNEGAGSLTGNEALLGKIFLPRLIFPIVPIAVASIDLAVSLSLFIILYFIFGFMFPLKAVLALGVLAVFFVLAIGMAILLSALCARYKDLRLALPTITQLLFFSSPIVYDVTLVPEKYWLIWGLNPLVGLIPALRWCVFENVEPPSLALFAMSVAIALIVLVVGLFYFHRVERDLVDAL